MTGSEPITEQRGGRAFAMAAGGAAIVLALTLAAYWPALQAGFIWDDDQYVTANALLDDVDGLRRIWIPRQTPQYYPAVFTTFWIEHQLWKLNPMGYHIVNVVLHALNAVLVWRLCSVLRIPGAWLIGAVFALHPVHVESVAWITERKNVLSGFFYLLAALAYLRFDDEALQRPAGPRWMWYSAALALFVLALLSKTVTCSLPAALILMMLWQRKPITIQRLTPLLPMFIIGLWLGLNTAAIERDHVLAVGPDFDFSITDRILIASRALLFYPLKLLWPVDLVFIYPRWTIDDSNVMGYVPVLAIVVIAAIVIVLSRRDPKWRGPALALAFFAGTIFPALGFINIYPMIFSFVADHFQYLASLGIVALVVGIVARRLDDPVRLGSLSLIVLPALGLLTWNQAWAYRDLETLWTHTLARNDQAWIAHNNMVPILLNQSQTAQRSGDAEAARTLVAKARIHGERAVALKDNHAPLHSNLSQVYLQENRFADGIRHIRRAIELWPDHADYHWQLGYLSEHAGRTFEAASAYRRALELQPDSIRCLASAARIAVKRGESVEAYSSFTTLLERLRSPDARIEAGDPIMLDDLARAFADARQMDQAIRAEQAAVELARRVKIVPLAEQFQRRLEAYRAAP
jgi:tetratricopeptide (TPR) repeat protein